jgi:hypothetical protein
MHKVQNGKAVLSAYVAALVVGIFSLLAIGWAAHQEGPSPTSATTVGLSPPGAGAGIYNGLRATSVPAATELSRLEQPASESVRGINLIQ